MRGSHGVAQYNACVPRRLNRMLLAADVGGTKTLLGLFESSPRRPVPVCTRTFETARFASFDALLDRFLGDAAPRSPIEAAAAGVAGPVVGDRARLTNVPWELSAEDLRARCGARRARLVNDLAAMAASVEVLGEDELTFLQRGEPDPGGNAVVIAAGTGLGQAYLHRVDGRLEPAASEGGHADFPARSEREFELVRRLRARFGRAEVEQVLSGPGLVHLFELTHPDGRCPVAGTEPDPADVTEAALGETCGACVDALEMFVSAYGSEAGNLALRGVATAGVFVGGGIAPRILPALRRGAFLAAFTDKPPMTALLARMPVAVIRDPGAALLGAAVTASRL